MRIGLFCGSLHRQGSGIQVYIRHLLESMARMDSDVDITLLYNISRCKLNDSDYRAVLSDINVKPFYMPEKYALRIWSRFHFPYIDFMHQKFDIIHSATSYLPPVRYAKKIVTAHDLAFIKHPDKLIISRARAHYSRGSIKHADLVIADSEYTRKDVVELLDIPEGSVMTIYPGIDQVFMHPRKNREMQEVLKRYNIDYPYFLFVGNIDPRKNLRGLLTAFGRFIDKHKKGVRLIIVGKRTSQADKELQIIDELGLGEQVRYLGYIPRGDLPALYANARIFIYPSFFEGFGFPVLEAMASGTPVITSNTSSLPEVCGDAAYYVTPGSVSSLVQALEKVDSDSRLRKAMISKGQKRARRFSWERTAIETIDCYKMMLKGN